MEKFLMILLFLNSFIISTFCCLMSGSGGCFTSGLSFGGRISLPTQAADLFNTSPWMQKKVFIFQRPRTLRKSRTVRSMFGPSGIVRFWKKDSSTCHRPTADDTETCPIDGRSSRPCLDKSVPCNVDFSQYGAKQLLISSNTSSPRVTIELPIRPDATFGENAVTGFKIEFRKLNSKNWSILEYPDTQPKDITDILEDGFTYEIKTSLKYGDSFSEPEASQTFKVPCRDLAIDLTLTSLSKRSGLARVIIDWAHRKLTDPCGLLNQTISVKQLDLDNCNDSNADPIDIIPDLGSHGYSLKRMYANSGYNVSLTVVTKKNTYNVQQTFRTVETAPTGATSEIDFRANKMRGTLMVRWNKLLCGQRNGEIQSYDIKMTRGDGSTAVHNTKKRMTMYDRFRMGHSFEVQVRAVTLAGVGPYSQKFGGIFGEPTVN
ncbi:uncharacterized protein [Apostichopus japonicus]|uniref:uncharacterized protein isoform X1 n=1 Tax=Stichopus japonicus TaxID=307972 RepID=UPI003AB3A5C7